MENLSNQDTGAVGCAHANVIYVQVQLGLKMNAVWSDSGLILLGLFWLGFSFKKLIYTCWVWIRSNSGRVQTLGWEDIYLETIEILHNHV